MASTKLNKYLVAGSVGNAYSRPAAESAAGIPAASGAATAAERGDANSSGTGFVSAVDDSNAEGRDWEEEVGLEFQASDASLIATRKFSDDESGFDFRKQTSKVVFPLSFLNHPSIAQPSVDPGEDDDDDVDEWAEVQITSAGQPISDHTPRHHVPNSCEADFPIPFASAWSNLCRSVAAYDLPFDAACCAALCLRLGVVLDGAAPSSRGVLEALAATPLNDTDSTHVDMLRSFRERLLPTGRRAPRYGAHWEEVGFQGTDPATDLRGVGVLGLLCLLHWSVDAPGSRLLADVHRLSRDPVQNFPLAVTSFNATRMCLRALKSGALDVEMARRERGVGEGGASATSLDDRLSAGAAVFFSLYRAAVRRLYLAWRDGRKTIVDAGFVLNSLEKGLLKDPLGAVREEEKGKGKGKSEKEKRIGKERMEVVGFTNLSELKEQ